MVTILRHPLKLALTGSGSFCQQHGIRQLSLQGEKLSSDLDAPDPFKEKLLKLIEDEDFTLELLYDCDETGLYYRMLPEKTLAARTEKGSSRNEEAKGVYNPHGLLQCYWYIQAPLNVCRKGTESTLLKNVNKSALPVKYFVQKNAWVDSEIFADWFYKEIVPAVKDMSEKSLPVKALLLLDNAPAHPDESVLLSSAKVSKQCFYHPILLL